MCSFFPTRGDALVWYEVLSLWAALRVGGHGAGREMMKNEMQQPFLKTHKRDISACVSGSQAMQFSFFPSHEQTVVSVRETCCCHVFSFMLRVNE